MLNDFPSYVYVLNVRDDVYSMKRIILVHLKTIYPFISNIITYIFEDGTMFIPISGTGYIYENIDYVDYERFRGMIPVVNCGLMRYILKDEYEYLGKIVLVDVDTDVEDISSSLRSQGYFSPNVDSPQHVRLYLELASLYGIEVIFKESDYIVLKGGGRLLDYVPTMCEYFERARDTFPEPVKLLVGQVSLPFTSYKKPDLS